MQYTVQKGDNLYNIAKKLEISEDAVVPFGLDKAKIIDSSFVWTEPHSKLIKVKIITVKITRPFFILTHFLSLFLV